VSAFALEIVFSPPSPEDRGASRPPHHHGLSDDEGEGYDPAERIAVHASIADCACCGGTGCCLTFAATSPGGRCPACKGTGIQRTQFAHTANRNYRASGERDLRPGEQLPW